MSHLQGFHWFLFATTSIKSLESHRLRVYHQWAPAHSIVYLRDVIPSSFPNFDEEGSIVSLQKTERLSAQTSSKVPRLYISVKTA